MNKGGIAVSIKDLIKNAKSVDPFADIPEEEKATINLKGKIAAAILDKRHDMNMNQNEFANYMNVSQSMISKWESGEYNFSCESIEQLRKIGISLSLEDKKFIEKHMKSLEYSYYMSSSTYKVYTSYIKSPKLYFNSVNYVH